MSEQLSLFSVLFVGNRLSVFNHVLVEKMLDDVLGW